MIVMDRKWFELIQQSLSNAVMYMPAGTVSIDFGEELDIADIGIAEDDVPCIFGIHGNQRQA